MGKKFLGGAILFLFVLGMLFIAIPQLLSRRALNWLRRADDDVRSFTERQWQATWARRYWRLFCHIMGMSMPPKFLGERHTMGGPYIYVLNHRCVLDHFLGQHVLACSGVKDSLWVIKQQMANEPVLGKSMGGAGYALVKRGGEDPEGDRERIRQMARRAKRIGASVVIYAEGTRYDAREWESLGRHSDYAPHLAPPRITGFAELCDELPDWPVKVVCMDWRGMIGGKTIWDGEAYAGLHGRVLIWEEENPGKDGAREFLYSMWDRMYNEMSGQADTRLKIARAREA